MSPRWEPNPDIRRAKHVVHNMHVHLVFVTKYRKKVFTQEILNDMKKIMTDICTAYQATLTEFNGEQDHVHLLIHYPPKIAVSVLVNSLKGVSSRLLRKKYPNHLNQYLWEGHLWSPSYFTASCGGAPLTIVKQYIQNQQTPT